jgi:hypothetical protein
MSHWTITGRVGCPVARYVTYVVSEEKLDGQSSGSEPLCCWVVEACEGQIHKVIHDPLVVNVSWERR